MQLTASKLAKYWGAKIYSLPHLPTVGQCVGIISEVVHVKYVEWKHTVPIQISDCKLILRPLSKITDEDAIMVAKILNQIKDVSNSEYMSRVGKLYVQRKVQTFPYYLVDFLRSIGYDCDNYLITGEAVEID